MEDFFGLSGKAVVVVGGGQGIGEAVSLLFAKAGCDVAIVDIERERAETVAGRVRELGRKSTVIIRDALDPANAALIIGDARRDLGRLDRLVTIIGVAAFLPTLEVTPEIWDLDQSRNLRYAFFLAQQFALGQIAAGQDGAVVFTTSVSGIQAAINHTAYGVAKAGLIHLTKTLATEWAQAGIRVNSVCPGGVVTPRYPDSPERRARKSPIPLGRAAQPNEIAGPALFLASDLASYVTGHTLRADGGWTIANLALPAPDILQTAAAAST